MALVLGLAQCAKKPNMPVYGGDYEVKSVTFSTTGNGQKGEFEDVTTALDYKWGPEDLIHVYATTDESDTEFANGEHCGVLHLTEGAGTTEGKFLNSELEIPAGAKWLRFVHFGRGYDETTAAKSFTVSKSLAEQTGSFDGVSNSVIAYCDKTVDPDDTYKGTLDVVFAVVKFDLSKFAKPTVCDVTAAGFTYDAVKVNPSGKVEYSFSSYNPTITFKNVQSTTTAFYAMLAKGGSTVAFKGNDWEGTKDFSNMSNGSFYAGIKINITRDYVDFDNPKLRVYKYNLGVDKENLVNASDYYGDYYAWGETATKEKYSWGVGVYKWQSEEGPDGNLTPPMTAFKTKYYNTDFTGETANYDYAQLLNEDDAVCYKKGDGWRMPTQAEFTALFENNHYEFVDSYADITDNAGVVVFLGKGAEPYDVDTDEHVFIPAAGDMDIAENKWTGEMGFYWFRDMHCESYTSPSVGTACWSHLGDDFNFTMEDKKVKLGDFNSKFYGFPLRPVKDIR